MALIKPVKGIQPQFGANCYLAENATIVGDVIAGDDCSFWFQCVVRGDVNSIRIGNKVNIQDGAVIHCTYQRAATIIGDNVSIGHRAIVHGCTLENNVLIGMGAIVMDGAEIGARSIVGAGAVVTQGQRIPPGSLVLGSPGRVVRALSRDEQASIRGWAEKYIRVAREHRTRLEAKNS
ncbi:MAG: gamma carbonic anhydrase family protein [Verrucomicrobiae bacterium]|nr:gamma carbonic anhydrase family protein [Verrucomicrobiae bacterium]